MTISSPGPLSPFQWYFDGWAGPRGWALAVLLVACTPAARHVVAPPQPVVSTVAAPAAARAAYLRARVLEGAGQAERAAPLWSQAIAVDPESPWLQLAVADRLPPAEREARLGALVDQHPTLPEIRLAWADAALYRRDTSTAQARLAGLPDLQERAPRRHAELGLVYGALGDLPTAWDDLVVAVRGGVCDPEVVALLTAAALRHRRYHTALNALAACPSAARARARLAMNAMDALAAAESWAVVTGAAPEDQEAWVGLASSRLALGDVPGALAAARVAGDPLLLAEVLIMQGQTGEARSWLSREESLPFADRVARRAWAWLAVGAPDRAAAEVSASRDAPSGDLALLDLQVALAPERAAELIASAPIPASARAVREAARLDRQGDPDAATRLLAEAIQAQPFPLDVADALAQRYAAAGQTDLAVAVWEAALRVEPTDPRALLALGLASLGRAPLRTFDLALRRLEVRPDGASWSLLAAALLALDRPEDAALARAQAALYSGGGSAP